MTRIAFEPIRIGNMVVPNRIVRTAHGTSLAGNEMSDDLIAYHVARAKGGCGLTILEAASIHWSSAITQSIASDDVIPGFRQLMAEVEPYGMKVIQQIWHGGAMYPSYRGVPWAVSTVPGALGVVGHPMDLAQIEELQGAFVATALRMQAAGLHGVEVHAAHGYLFHQFLSPVYNNRTDHYGGPLENRMRFLLEVLRKIRSAVAPDFIVGVRVGVSEAPGGLTVEDIRPVNRAMEAEGLIDYLNASLGDYYKMASFYGTMESPAGYELPAIAPLTEGVGVPRIVTGRFRTIDEVEQVLRDGTADLVSMVRAQIADPDLVNKTREGRATEVRPCIACNQGCVGGYARDHRMGCTVNPAVGYERTLAEDLIQPAERPRKVMIVGGGPGGLEAARIAALAGHHVILAEAAARLGGTIEIARRVPRYHALGDIIYWLEQEVFRLGVDVRLGTYVEADDVRAEAPDILIVATGAMPRMDGFQIGDPAEPAIGCGQSHVVSAVDLIADPRRVLGTTALILDTTGHFEGLAAAEHLLVHGVKVTLVTHNGTMSPYVDTTLRTIPTLERFFTLGTFEVLLRHHLVEIGEKSCRVRPLWGREHEREIPADTVVLVTQNEPLRELYDALKGEISEIYLIGDSSSPRDMLVAIQEGHRTARAMGANA